MSDEECAFAILGCFLEHVENAQSTRSRRSARQGERQVRSDFGLSVPFDMRLVMGSLQSPGLEQVRRIPRCRF
ncbi:hypothetical protein [Ideonella sp.]|uniref:hypothetical protein n=1 Tax=Ideonella sp. TaxID=1929293 RepID=UPI002B4990BF|nr:hypothetical protein [Ideonella sp.]HJV67809.1 hypothetical protein [Ideonella sp.]